MAQLIRVGAFIVCAVSAATAFANLLLYGGALLDDRQCAVVIIVSVTAAAASWGADGLAAAVRRF